MTFPRNHNFPGLADLLVLLHFPMVLKHFEKLFADLGNYWRSSLDVRAETQGFPMIFARFQKAALRRLGPAVFVAYITFMPSIQALT